MSSDQGLAALVVNYNSGAFAVQCVDSLIREWLRQGRRRDLLQIVLVDNASPEDQTEHLLRIETTGTQVIRSETNLGYAGGMNLAYSKTQGKPTDCVAILNPDIHFLPESVSTLMDYVTENHGVGAVDPRACIDPLGVLNLPRNLLPTPVDQLRITLAHMSPFWSRRYSRQRLKKAIPWWTADGPIETDMLSGCCLFMRREVVDELPVLMDERFPLYFEDTDLFRSLSKLGYKIVHHGGARILHHWSRSAGVGRQFEGETARRYGISQKAYFQKYYGGMGLRYVSCLAAIERRWPQERMYRPMHELQQLGAFADPVEIPLPRSCRYLVEGAVEPSWIIACGILGKGDRWICPEESWEWFFDTNYFMRAIDLDTGDFLGAWTFSKTTPGRTTPAEPDELAAYGDRLFGGSK